MYELAVSGRKRLLCRINTNRICVYEFENNMLAAIVSVDGAEDTDMVLKLTNSAPLWTTAPVTSGPICVRHPAVSDDPTLGLTHT